MPVWHAVYCPVLRQDLPDPLTAQRCDGWRRETRETDAGQLYAELNDPSR